MNTINGMSFYDSLTKLTIGFLLTWWWLPGHLPAIVKEEYIQFTLYFIMCFLTGCLWQGLAELLPKYDKESHRILDWIPYSKRNYMPWIIEEWKKHYNEGIDTIPTKHDYYCAYYKLQKAGLLGNIPILEALEAFLRYGMIPSIIVSIISVYNGGISFLEQIKSESNNCIGAFLAILITLFLLCLPCLYLYTWRNYNKKVYRLVWEAKFFLDKLEEEERDNASATKNEKQDISIPATEKEQ